MQGTLLLGMGMKRNDAGKPDGAGEPVVCLKLANTGEKTVSVVEVRMVQPSGAYMRLESMGAERPFPPVIEPGDSIRCWIGLGKVTDILRVGGGTGKVRLTFEVKDALGHIHKDEMVIRHRRVGSVLGLLLRASRSEVTRTRARLPPSPVAKARPPAPRIPLPRAEWHENSSPAEVRFLPTRVLDAFARSSAGVGR
jgi:hypothetical protein